MVAPYSGAMLAIVARSGRLRLRKARTVELDEFADHAFLAQHFGDDQHQVGGRRAFRQAAVQLEADDFGISIESGWPSMAASASIPPTPHPNNAKAVDHRGVRIGADQRIGERVRLAVCFVDVKHDARQVFEIHLVADAGVGRHNVEIVERRCAPAEERVALDVALVLEFRVERKRPSEPNLSTCTE